jgi:hypothetical protein
MRTRTPSLSINTSPKAHSATAGSRLPNGMGRKTRPAAMRQHKSMQRSAQVDVRNSSRGLSSLSNRRRRGRTDATIRATALRSQDRALTDRGSHGRGDPTISCTDSSNKGSPSRVVMPGMIPTMTAGIAKTRIRAPKARSPTVSSRLPNAMRSESPSFASRSSSSDRCSRLRAARRLIGPGRGIRSTRPLHGTTLARIH